MSSPPAERRRRAFEPWRKVMLAGAFILLGNALGQALIEGGLPSWGRFILTFLGYGFLAAGFGMRMRALKAEKDARSTDEKEAGRES